MQSNRRRGRDNFARSTDAPTGGESGVCTLVIGSMTQAMAAQKALAEAAIRVSIVKISSSRTHNGCAYGLDLPCTQIGNVRTVLGRAGVRIRGEV